MSQTFRTQAADGVVARVPGKGVVFKHGNTVPADTTPGYAPGCIFLHINGSAGDVLYVNNGTNTSCLFQAVPTAGATGAADIGIADAGNFTSQTTVEGALQELYQTDLSVQGGTIDIPLPDLRFLQADGSVGNNVQNGGLLSNETTPNLSFNGNGAAQIGIAANNVNKLMTSFPIPPDMDPAGTLTISFGVKGGGTTNAFGMGCSLSIDGGTATTAAANLTTANAAFQVANAAFPANTTANSLAATLTMTPASHATDAWFIHSIRATYKKKLLTA